MSSHMPPVPPANRSNKGSPPSRKPGKRNNAQGAENRTVKQTEQRHNAAEEGETANIKQNTTNKGFFEGAERVDCVFNNRAQESATVATAISGRQAAVGHGWHISQRPSGVRKPLGASSAREE